MTVRKVEIERLSVISSKPFEEVLETLEAAIYLGSSFLTLLL
jgi:hypothetical protein